MSTSTPPVPAAEPVKQRQKLSSVTVRFAGDSGDGVQITGDQFTQTTAIAGNDLATLPDYPAEIRAPAGTLPGVSGFQIQFAATDIFTPGDHPDVLVVFNPAALKVHVPDLPQNGILIADTKKFDKSNLAKAGYASNPLDDGSLSKYRFFAEPITEMTIKSLRDITDLSAREKERCKNFFALGMAYWLFNRSLEPSMRWIEGKFKKTPLISQACQTALRAGYTYCDVTEPFHAVAYEIPPAPTKAGTYRNISGNQALALGLVAAAERTGLPLFYGAYPITPASDILHELAKHKNFGIMTFQAEDEIAAMASVVGASFSGALAVAGTAGPGLALKSEALSLAVMTELPVVVIDVQRGGPSTGLPTKTEQADLLFALYGRHGEAPVAIIAPATPGENFNLVLEACRLAVKHMTPVIFLSDGYLANGSEPWRIPEMSELPEMKAHYASANTPNFNPYARDPKTLARPWAIPGTAGLEHRIGGLEKREVTGHVSYDPVNHEKMCLTRAEKIERMADDIPPLEVTGDEDADLLVLGWGSTYGSICAGCRRARENGRKVAQAHLRYLNPMPKNTEAVLKRFKKVLIPELNLGQLSLLVRGKFLVDCVALNKVQGSPFSGQEMYQAIAAVLDGKPVKQPGEAVSTSTVQISEG